MIDTTKLNDIYANNASMALTDVRHKEVLDTQTRVADTILSATSSLIKYLEGATTKTEVVNQLESIHTPDVEYVVKALNVLDDTLKTHENTDLTEITKVMQSILDEAKLLPKELPTIPEHKVIDNTKQFQDLTKAIQSVEKVVKAQKLIAEAPIVNVPETNVNVEPPDLKPLQQGFKDVVKAVTGIVIPEYKTDNAGVEKLLKEANKTLVKLLEKPVSGGGGGGGSSWIAVNSAGIPVPIQLDASGNLPTAGGTTYAVNDIEDDVTSYFGKTTSDGTYQIRKVIDTKVSYATLLNNSGVATYTDAWADRATLTYGRYDQAF